MGSKILFFLSTNKKYLLLYFFVLIFIPLSFVLIKNSFFKPKINSVTTFDSKIEQVLKAGDILAGKGIPGGTVRISVAQLKDKDKKYKTEVETDKEGEWNYQIQSDLPVSNYNLKISLFDKQKHIASVKVYKIKVVGKTASFNIIPEIYAQAAQPQNKLSIPSQYATIVLRNAPQIRLGSEPDSNIPVYWDKSEVHALISSPINATPYRNKAINNISNLDISKTVEYSETNIENQKQSGFIWFESIIEQEGILYGFYHNEPPGEEIGIPAYDDEDHYLTAPRIGVARSFDNGSTWEDLGIIYEESEDTFNKETKNTFFAGGIGDFSVVNGYIFATAYNKDPAKQGIVVFKLNQLDKPQSEKITPSMIFPAYYDVHDFNADFFWGPSVHFNSHLNMYVMFLNRADDENLNQAGIYVSFNRDINDPAGWSFPQEIHSGGKWYPQIIGISAGETDQQAGRVTRYFENGVSNTEIYFLKPGESSDGSESPIAEQPIGEQTKEIKIINIPAEIEADDTINISLICSTDDIVENCESANQYVTFTLEDPQGEANQITLPSQVISLNNYTITIPEAVMPGQKEINVSLELNDKILDSDSQLINIEESKVEDNPLIPNFIEVLFENVVEGVRDILIEQVYEPAQDIIPILPDLHKTEEEPTPTSPSDEKQSSQPSITIPEATPQEGPQEEPKPQAGPQVTQPNQTQTTPEPEAEPTLTPVYCPQDVKQCPDGSFVSRIPPSCEFASCPTPTPTPSPVIEIVKMTVNNQEMDLETLILDLHLPGTGGQAEPFNIPVEITFSDGSKKYTALSFNYQPPESIQPTQEPSQTPTSTPEPTPHPRCPQNATACWRDANNCSDQEGADVECTRNYGKGSICTQVEDKPNTYDDGCTIPPKSIVSIKINHQEMDLETLVLNLHLSGTESQTQTFEIPIEITLSDGSKDYRVLNFNYQPKSIEPSPTPPTCPNWQFLRNECTGCNQARSVEKDSCTGQTRISAENVYDSGCSGPQWCQQPTPTPEPPQPVCTTSCGRDNGQNCTNKYKADTECADYYEDESICSFTDPGPREDGCIPQNLL